MSSPDKFRELAAGFVDNELTDAERKEFQSMLEENPELRADVASFEKINNLTSQVRFEELPDPLWEAYGASWYRKSESYLAWVLISIGVMIAIGLGSWSMWSEFFTNDTVPLIKRIGGGTLLVGAIILLVSKLRETLFAHKRDRYRKVMK